jgi:hypothetical protein
MIRMAAAPGQKHVPLQFPGWICMQEDCVSDNVFASSQLLTDRWGPQTCAYMLHVQLIQSVFLVLDGTNAGALVQTSAGSPRAVMWFQRQPKT